MKVILQENVDNLGYVGDILDVANGYARNYLLPRKKAMEANTRNVKALEHVKWATAAKVKQVEQGLKGEAEKLSGVSLTFEVQAGKDDKLFGSVTSKDIEAKLLAQGFEVDRRKIQLPQPLKELGNTKISVKLFRDINAEISVMLVKKGGESSAAEGATEAKEPAEIAENVGTEADQSEVES